LELILWKKLNVWQCSWRAVKVQDLAFLLNDRQNLLCLTVENTGLSISRFLTVLIRE
jgi:hypothetical protein